MERLPAAQSSRAVRRAAPLVVMRALTIRLSVAFRSRLARRRYDGQRAGRVLKYTAGDGAEEE